MDEKIIIEGKVSGKVYSFQDFVNEQITNENTGYGDLPFFYAKNGDASNYFFKIEDQQHKAFVLTIGKFSKFTQPTEAKTDYGVLSIQELKEEELDQAVVDNGHFNPNTEEIHVDEMILVKIFNQIAICIGDYVQKNPKVNKFYDENEALLKGPDYDNKMAVSLSKWPGGNDTWKLQVIEKGKLNMISK